MLCLNLLPENHKLKLQKEYYFLLAHIVSGVLFIAVSIAAIVLLAARAILVTEFQKIKNDTSLVKTEHQALEIQIDAINKTIATVDKVQLNFSKWSQFLNNLNALLPAGITANYLLINQDTRNFRLTGLAADREVLLAAKAKLEQSGWFEKLETPLANFLEPANAEFQFTGQLKPAAWPASAS